MSQFQASEPADVPIRQPITETPLEGVAVAAGLQGAASIIYAVSGLFAALACFAIRGLASVLLSLSGLGLLLNFFLSTVAAAMLTFADTGTKARGVGTALLVFTLLPLAVPALLVRILFLERGDDLGTLMFGGFFFSIFEVTRHSLIGWYVAVVAPPGRLDLSSAGQALGLLVPVVLAPALLMSVEAWRTAPPVALALIALGYLVLFAGLVIFSAVLMLRLRGAVKDSPRLTK